MNSLLFSPPDALAPTWGALASAYNGTAAGFGPSVHAFAILLVFLFLCAIPAFFLGVLAGWLQWKFLAQRSIAGLNRHVAALREALQATASSPDPTR